MAASARGDIGARFRTHLSRIPHEQWLVISGSMAQFKGSGTAITNGISQPANFLLTARDGDMNGGTAPDGFRIKITDSSGAVIYDNLIGAPEDCTAANPQTIAGGNVMIHKG